MKIFYSSNKNFLFALNLLQKNIFTTIICVFCLLHTAGCSVKYNSYIKCKLSPKDWRSIKFVDGEFGKSKELSGKAQLPHLSPKERVVLQFQALDELTKQLGSPNYSLIGEVFVGGNAYVNMDDVKEMMAKRASKEGGEVILIFRSGVEAQPWSYTTPGYATSSTYGSANATNYGNSTYITGQAQTSTTYTPPQTHSGVHYKPYCQGLVFKYNPKRDERVKGILQLDEKQFQEFDKYADSLNGMDCESEWNALDKFLEAQIK